MAGLLKQRGDYNRYHRAASAARWRSFVREEGLPGSHAGLSPKLAGAFSSTRASNSPTYA